MDHATLLTLSIGVITVVIALYAAFFARKSYLLQKKVAEVGKDVYSPVMHMQLGDFQKEQRIDGIIILAEFNKYKALIIHLPINIKNISEKTAYDVNLLVRINKQIFFGGTPNLKEIGLAGGFQDVEIRKVDETISHELLSLKLGDFHPDLALKFYLPISIKGATFLEGTMDAETKNKKKASMDYNIDLLYGIELFLSYKDSRVFRLPLSIRVIDKKGEEATEALNEYGLYKRKEFLKHLESRTLLQRFKMFLSRKPFQKILIPKSCKPIFDRSITTLLIWL